MSAAFILTKHVKHLATWTQDREQTGSWETGAYRPICGGKVRDVHSTFHPHCDFEGEAITARAERLSLCRLCLKALARINAAVDGAS